jgi:hypothetical protein
MRNARLVDFVRLRCARCGCNAAMTHAREALHIVCPGTGVQQQYVVRAFWNEVPGCALFEVGQAAGNATLRATGGTHGCQLAPMTLLWRAQGIMQAGAVGIRKAAGFCKSNITIFSGHLAAG